MRFLIQRVTNGSVTTGGQTVGQIGKGFVVLIGIGQDDTEAVADKMVKKLLGLRIFADENGKTNLALKDVGGELLLISQFTLYADCRHGNRPGFTLAGDPKRSEELYEYIIGLCRKEVAGVECGVFGADMAVSMVNDGPFTIFLDSEQLQK